VNALPERAQEPKQQTARWVELVYGRQQPALDDLAEAYHEASKISPTQIGRQIEGARRLDSSPELQLSMTRAVKRLGRPYASLPPPVRLDVSLWEAIEARCSQRSFSAEPVAGGELAALLHAAYGVTHSLESPDGRRALPLRAVPSGGALYPLELYVAALRIDGLEPGLYHFDPLRAALEVVGTALTPDEVAALSTYPDIVSGCAALLLVAAVFGRTRFKYGLRGYRFAVLEAGHVGQNVVLAATALGLGAVPLGGFYDRRTDEFLALDGVNESTLYTIAVGRALDG
jgi:SagB-type dehydrogenase family enzyme